MKTYFYILSIFWLGLCLSIIISVGFFIFCMKNTFKQVYVYYVRGYEMLAINDFMYYSIFNSRIYFDITGVINSFTLTYLVSFFGLNFWLLKMPPHESIDIFSNRIIHWSPFYDVCKIRLQSLLSILKYDLKILLPNLCLIVLSFLLYIIILFIHVDLNISLHSNFFYVSLFLVFVLVFIKFYLVNRGTLISDSVQDQKFFLVKYLSFIITVFFTLLGNVPLFLVNILNFFFNVFVLINLFDYFGLSDFYFSVFLSYNITLLLFDIIFILLPFSHLSFFKRINFVSFMSYSIFTFPLATILIYLYYSYMWWVQFIITALLLGDITLVYRYIIDRFIRGIINFDTYWKNFYVSNYVASLWHYTSYYDGRDDIVWRCFIPLNNYSQLLCESYINGYVYLCCFANFKNLTQWSLNNPFISCSEFGLEQKYLRWTKNCGNLHLFPKKGRKKRR